jgi:hypothetical protein
MRDRRESNRWAAVVMAGVLAACGGGDGGDEASTGGPAAAPAQVENAGTINGVINFAGQAPAPTPIDMSGEPDCLAKHDEAPTRRQVVTNDGRLANVFIYIKEGLSGSYPASGQGPEVDQDGCIYHPHVVGRPDGPGRDLPQQ